MKAMAPLLSIGILLSLLFILNFYLGKRFAYFLGMEGYWKLFAFFLISLLVTMFGTFSLINATSFLGHSVAYVLGILMGFYLYLLIGTLFSEAFGIGLKLAPRSQLLIALSIAVLFSGYGLWNAQHLRLNTVEIPVSALKGPLKAVHLTDTHLGHYRGARNLERIVTRINKQEPDVVFFTGDLLDSKYQLKPSSMEPLSKLKAPIFFVEGNHDEYTGIKAIKSQLLELGVRVLGNEIAEWNGIQIIGLDYMIADSNAYSSHAIPGRATIRSVLEGMAIDPEKPSIVLHHGPDGLEYAEKAGVDLYLAGHTHGGQMWPATYIAKMIFAVNRGLDNLGKMKVYVSQGTGTFGPPMRVGTYSELTILNLIPK